MAEAFGLAVNVATVVDLLLKIGIQCSEYCANVKSAPRDIRDILREADRFGATLRDIERLLNGPNRAKIDNSRNLRDSIDDCRQQLHILATKLDQGTRKARLAWPLKKQEVTDILAKLKRHRDAIVSDLHIHQTTVLRTLHQDVVLQKLRIVEQAGFETHNEANSSTCLPGTRTNILRQISEWHAARDSKTIFWLNGMAGTGKSTISRTVAKVFSDSGMLGGSFFFKRGDGDRGRVAFFFPTIVAQLIRQIPSLASFVRDQLEADPSISTKAISKQFEDLVASPIGQLPQHANRQTMILVIDALDECDNFADLRLLIRLLDQTKHFTSLRLKFLITSRPELPIQLGFNDIHGQYDGLILQEIPQPDIHHDITLFMRHELAKIRHDWNSHARADRQLSPNWPEADTQTLIDMAVPLFIFATTVCRYLGDRRLGSPTDQLLKVLKRQGGHWSTLDKTYLPVLDGLSIELAESEKEEVAKRFKKIVGSIIMLASPLSTSALAQLLGIPRDTIEDQLDLLHSVLSVPLDHEKPIQLLHLSFRDFLIDPTKRSMTAFWVDEGHVHQDIVANCLRVMEAGLRRDMCDLRAPGTARSDINQRTIAERIPPEIEYACLYWVDHLKKGGTYVLHDDICGFLSTHLLHWIEVLSLVGRTSGIPGILETLRSLFMKPETNQEVLTLLDDSVRFSLAYLSTIDSYPLQIYALIAFLPTRSSLRILSIKRQWAWLSVSGDLDLNWDSCLQTIEAHDGVITSVVFSPDAKLLASASDDETIQFWNAETGHYLQTLVGHSETVNSIAFSLDAKRLASASDDQTIRLWDTETGQYLQTFTGHSGSVNSVAFSPNAKALLASASDDRTVRLWDADTGQYLQTFTGHSGSVNSVAFSPNAKGLLASASDDRTVRLWDIETGQYLQTLAGHSGPVTSIAFSPDAKCLASGSDDQTIQLWDTETSQCLKELIGHDGLISSIEFSPDAKCLASASDDQSIQLWDIETGQCEQIFEGHNSPVTSIAFSLDAKCLASASFDGTIRLWDVEPNQYPQTIEGHSAWVNSVVFSPDAKLVASASFDETIRLWNAETGLCLQTFDSGVSDVSFTLDGSCLQTKTEILAIESSHLSPLPPKRTCKANDSTQPRCGLDEDHCWVTWDGDEILWLPPSLRPGSLESVATSGSSIAIGSSSGKVTFVCIHANMVS